MVGLGDLGSQQRTCWEQWRWEEWGPTTRGAWWCLTTPCCPSWSQKGPVTGREYSQQTGPRPSPWASANGPARSRDSAGRCAFPASERRAPCLHCCFVAEQFHWLKVKFHPGKLPVGSLSWQISCSWALRIWVVPFAPVVVAGTPRCWPALWWCWPSPVSFWK